MGSGTMGFYICNSTKVNSIFTTGGGLNNGVWHHYVGVKNSTTIVIYLDGVLNNSLAGIITGSITTTTPFWIGDYSATYSWSGQIDEVMVFNRALSSSEIKQIYDSQSGQLKSCSDQGGDICSGNEYCPGNEITANDTTRCCNVSCAVPSWLTCAECGKGIFNLCDRTECESIIEGCYRS